MKKVFLFALLILMMFQSFAAEGDTLYYQCGKMKSPALALSLSFVLPGSGQVYNEKWGKGILFFTGNAALVGSTAYYYMQFGKNKDLYGLNDSRTQQSLLIAKRITWFSAALYVYNLIDAYVDAHLSAFPDEALILQPNPDMPGLRISMKF